VAKSAPWEEEEVFPLDDDPVMDMHNLSYDELQKKIIQAHKKNFLDGLGSPGFMRERGIMADTKKNPKAFAIASLAFIGAAKSNIEFLMDENKELTKNL